MAILRVVCGYFKCHGQASILSAAQALLTAPLESTHLSWRGSLLTHVLCRQLASLERHGADAQACTLSTCAQVSLQAHLYSSCKGIAWRPGAMRNIMRPHPLQGGMVFQVIWRCGDHCGWHCSLHTLDLASNCMLVVSGSTYANVLQVLNASQALKLAQPTGKYQDAVMELCAEAAGDQPGHQKLQSPCGVAAYKAFAMSDIALPLVPPAIIPVLLSYIAFKVYADMRALLPGVCDAHDDHQGMTQFVTPNVPSGFHE